MPLLYHIDYLLSSGFAIKNKAAMEKFGLDFDSYTEADIRRKNINSAKEIAGSLAGSKMYSFGSLLTGSANETFSLELQRAQVEQNFILMRQNEEIIRLLKKLRGIEYVSVIDGLSIRD